MKNLGLILSFILILFGQSAVAQEFAQRQLNESPRHHEWVEVKDGDRTIHSFVAYPEVSKDTLAVLVIHENRGLTDWVRSFADQVAEAGYIAIAPDLLSEFDDERDRTAAFDTSDAARDALYRLDPDRVTSDLKAVQAYIAQAPGANGKTVVAGFCWGGSQSFRFATHSPDLAAALVFYGSAPTDEEAIARIRAPVFGFYGENDQRINATLPETEELMDRYDRRFEYKIHDGAGHAYMRSGDDPNGSEANVRARDQSWEWIKEILKNL